MEHLEPQLISPRWRLTAILITVSAVALLLFAVLNPHLFYLRRGAVLDISFQVPGEPVTRALSQFRGRVIVATLIGPNCDACLTQLGELSGLAQSYGRDGLMAVALADQPQDLSANISLRSMPILAGVLPKIQADILPRQRPHTYILDREGRVVLESTRAERADRLAKLIEKLLGS